MEDEVEALAKLFGQECCMNDEKHKPCIDCLYKARQVIRFGYRRTNQMVALEFNQVCRSIHDNCLSHFGQLDGISDIAGVICSKFGLPQKSVEEISNIFYENGYKGVNKSGHETAYIPSEEYKFVAQAVHRLVYGSQDDK